MLIYVSIWIFYISSVVSFPKLKPVFRLLIRHVVIGDAMDYLAKASQEIIKSRKELDDEKSAVCDLLMFTRDFIVVYIVLQIYSV